MTEALLKRALAAYWGQEGNFPYQETLSMRRALTVAGISLTPIGAEQTDRVAAMMAEAMSGAATPSDVKAATKALHALQVHFALVPRI